MSDDAKREILAIIRAQEDANFRGDAANVVAPMADDIVTYDLPPPLAYRGAGPAAIEGLNRWFDTWDGPVTVRLYDPTVIVDRDLAVVFGLSQMQGRKKGGEPVNSWNRRTVVFRRIGGEWRIVHEHSSYPTEMDGSGRSATDLAP